MDAVNELKGDVCNVATYREKTDRWIYIVHSVGDDYYDTLSYNDDCVWELLCSIEEFNTLVQECMTNFGSSVTYGEYKESMFALDAADDKAVINWSEAPDGCVGYSVSSASKCYWMFSCHQVSAPNFGFTEFKFHPKPQPIFTKAMQEDGELPPIGSDVEYNDDIDFDFKFDWDNGDIITCVFHSTNDKGEPIGVYRHNDGVTVSLVTNLIRPIDTRTDKEKDIDEACLIIDDSKRCVDTNINIDCSAAQKAVIITMINNGYKKT